MLEGEEDAMIGVSDTETVSVVDEVDVDNILVVG